MKCWTAQVRLIVSTLKVMQTSAEDARMPESNDDIGEEALVASGDRDVLRPMREVSGASRSVQMALARHMP